MLAAPTLGGHPPGGPGPAGASHRPRTRSATVRRAVSRSVRGETGGPRRGRPPQPSRGHPGIVEEEVWPPARPARSPGSRSAAERAVPAGRRREVPGPPAGGPCGGPEWAPSSKRWRSPRSRGPLRPGRPPVVGRFVFSSSYRGAGQAYVRGEAGKGERPDVTATARRVGLVGPPATVRPGLPVPRMCGTPTPWLTAQTLPPTRSASTVTVTRTSPGWRHG